MLWGAIASFILAAIMAMLVGLGVWHAVRTPEEEPLLAPKPVAAH
jgi:predicted small integral membrane protein